MFTVLRDPLELNISMYYFAKKTKMFGSIDLELDNFLRLQKNYIAQRFQCTQENFKEVVDRYFFIGLQEDLQGSLDTLSHLFNKRKLTLDVVNASRRPGRSEKLDQSLIDEYAENNRLDYEIYEYCKQRYAQDKSRI